MKRYLLTVTSCLGALVALTNCGGSSSTSSSSSGATVTGTLSQAAVSGVDDAVGKFDNTFAVTNTKVSLDCGASGTFTAVVDPTTGSFSAPGVPTGVPCSFSFVSNDTKATVKCQVGFTDSANYDLNNNPMSTSTAATKGDLAMGSITCDSTGKISVPTSGLSNVDAGGAVAASTAFDFTGTWSAATYDGTVPTGYATIANCTTNCQGPSVGQKISLIRFHGNKFTPNAGQCTPAINVSCPVASGTVDATVDGYAMSIWGGDFTNGIGACGANTGFTADEARAYARLSLDTAPPSLTGHALTYGHYSWSTPTGFGGDANWSQPWMYTGATSSWDVRDCQPVAIPASTGTTKKPGFACFVPTHDPNGGGAGVATDGAPYFWQVGFQNAGGCVDASGNPIMVSNWSNLHGTCTQTASTFNSNFQTNSCTYTGSVDGTATATTFTCSYTGGMFNDISTSTTSTDNNGPDFTSTHTVASGKWAGQPAVLLAQNANCADGSNTEANQLTAAGSAPYTTASAAKAAKNLLVRYQCYANNYWKHTSNGGGSTTCARNYNFNWATNDYSKFITGDDRSMKPQNAYITDRVFYSSDGSWAYLKNTDTRFQTVPTATGSTLCPLENTTQLKFHKVSATKITVFLNMTTVMADRTAACQGAMAAALAGGGTIASDNYGLNNLYQQLQPHSFIFNMTQ